MWQTWTLVSKTPQVETVFEDTAEHSGLQDEMRYKVQVARIDMRMSVVQLAAAAKCDADTLAGYERGDEVLNSDILARIQRVLRLA